MTTRISIQGNETGAVAPVDAAIDTAAIPEKFNGDAGKLAKSYNDLQAELTALKQGQGLEAAPVVADPASAKGLGIVEPDAAKAAADAAAATDADAAKKIEAASGFALTSYETEFNSTGDVAPESRAKIVEGLKGILGEQAELIVNNYIEGQKDRASNNEAIVKDAAGGVEAYAAMVGWASGALSKAEIAVFNQQVNSGNVTAATFAVEALRSKFERTNGREPNKFTAKSFPVGGGNAAAFKSTAELTAAQRDPRYKTDQAYRDEVKNRLKASSI